jgi:hypothetical protein
MSHSDWALIDFAERDEMYVTLSCVLFSIVVDSLSFVDDIASLIQMTFVPS